VVEEGRKNGNGALNLHEIGWLELSPCAVADREYPNRLPPFIDFVYDPINVRLLAVKQVAQLSLCPSSFRCKRTAMGMRRKCIHSLLQVVVPPSGIAGLGGALFHVKNL
jgi:hypothetical protein